MKLPSKLSTFEQFLYFDDYPAYPNTIGCRLNLKGSLDVESLKKAVELTFARNPLLNTTLTKNRKLAWSEYHKEPIVRKIGGQYVGQHYLKKIDLDEESGGQLHWAQQNDLSTLNFLVHHATADGIGGMRVIKDLLTAYAILSSSAVDKSKTAKEVVDSQIGRTDPSLLDRRGSYRFCSWRFFKSLPRQLIGLFGVREFFANSPETLTGQRHGSLNESIPADYPGVVTRDLVEIDSLRSSAGQENVTTNELILQCIFMATAKWRQDRNFGSQDDLLRIMVPINLRSVADRYLPSCHRSSMVTLDRRQSKCLDEKALLNSIRFQMNVIKSNQLGYTFLHMLNLSRWFPKGVRRFADPKRIGATVLVTNLGEPFRRVKLPRDQRGNLKIGHMTLESVELMPPLRPNTQAAFAIGRYAGKSFLSLVYDNRILTKESAIDLVDRVCEEYSKKTPGQQ